MCGVLAGLVLRSLIDVLSMCNGGRKEGGGVRERKRREFSCNDTIPTATRTNSNGAGRDPARRQVGQPDEPLSPEEGG